MKKMEIVIAILVILALILESLLISGGNILLILGLITLIIIYYPLGFFAFNSIPFQKIFQKKSYKGISFLVGLGTVAAGTSFAITLTGVIFKLMMLPGADVMLLAGLIGNVAVLIVVFLKYFRNTGSKFYQQMLMRVMIIGVFGAVLYFTSGNSLVGFFYRDHPEFVDAFKAASENPDDIELQIKLDEAQQKMLNEE